jgi:hypothetical protein
MVNAERLRLDEARAGRVPWRRWGPYLSERQRGNRAGIGASRQAGLTATAGLLPLLVRGISAEGLRTRGRGAITSAAAGRRTGAAR